MLTSLNEKQRLAVTAPTSGVLQIIAGPGTGKTKVLVSRVAYLLQHQHIPPQNIIVTTFTKKAANEMMQRLRDLLAGTDIVVGKLLIGTFHSICYRIIQKYAKLIDLEGYTIADEKDSLQILADVISSKLTDVEWALVDALPEEETLPFKQKASDDGKYRGYNVKSFKKHISRAKSAGKTPEEYDQQRDKNQMLALVYHIYQSQLRKNKLLDFDDCLLYCYKIVSRFPVLNYIQHTLVDEFQDTNEIQLQLMYQFAKGHPTDETWQDNVTIVGDPDQSIYAFRDSQAANFEKMKQHYLSKLGFTCNSITLDENYRSSSGILTLSESIMRQQKNRMAKSLKSQMSSSLKPLKAVLKSSEEEARWVAHHIEYLKKLPGDLFLHSDVAVLVRSAYQTRVLEAELTKKRIPYFMVRGRAFWERKEVLAMLDCLRSVGSENDRLALLRSVNFPKRGLGPKAIQELERVIDQQQGFDANLLAYEVLHRIALSRLESLLGPKMKDSLSSFLSVIDGAKKLANDDFQNAPENTMDQVFMYLYKASGLQKEFEEDPNADLNIMEVKTQLMSFQVPEEDDLPDFVEGDDSNQQIASQIELSGSEFISKFVALVSLYTTDSDKSTNDTPKVAISTIHGAKGLEWPVVFVPGVSEGLLPAAFSIDEKVPETINEERRCFYVAASRAKVLLHVSAYTEEIGKWGRKPIERPSRFLDNLGDATTSQHEIKNADMLRKLALMLGKSLPTDDNMEACYKAYLSELREYVYEERSSDTKLDLGFTTASQVPANGFKRMARIHSAVAKTKSMKLGNTTQSSIAPHIAARAPPYIPVRTKAPAYVPVRPLASKPAGDSGSSAVASSKIAGSSRAPVYVVERTGTKRRLGTR